MHVAGALALFAAAASSAMPVVSHVRSTDRALTAHLADGCRRSPTMRALVGRLDASDLFVYVEAGRRLGGGYLLFAESTAYGRYARVIVDVDLDVPQLIAVIAHELRHATEIADAPEVIDRPSFQSFYERIGTRRTHCSSGPACYETAAAEDAAATVFREICGRSVPPGGLRTHW